MPRILVAEDTKFFGNMLRRRLETDLDAEVVVCTTMEATRQAMEDDGSFDAAILDLTLADSVAGEVVDIVAPSVPAIVFTGHLDNKTRNGIWAKGVADYVLKEGGEHSVDYTVQAIRRILEFRGAKVLVADDSKTQRAQVRALLAAHGYVAVEAGDGREALDILEQDQGIRLLITDYNMPKMDGFELIRTLRKTRNKDVLPIVGMSAEGKRMLSVQFIKNGANDFLVKPFTSEEFYCRLNHNLDLLAYIDQLREAGFRDFLTGLYNRKYFFEGGRRLFECMVKDGGAVVAMVDIDHFKDVNDTFGHDAGDRVIKDVADLLERYAGEAGLVARFGGEEFCMLLPEMSLLEAEAFFERLRAEVEADTLVYAGKSIPSTVSIGACVDPGGRSLEKMLREADQRLFAAKQGGRNRVELTT